jgi:hypothetical protein
MCAAGCLKSSNVRCTLLRLDEAEEGGWGLPWDGRPGRRRRVGGSFQGVRRRGRHHAGLNAVGGRSTWRLVARARVSASFCGPAWRSSSRASADAAASNYAMHTGSNTVTGRQTAAQQHLHRTLSTGARLGFAGEPERDLDHEGRGRS